jgi:uncharacterized protein with GYD domain
VRARLRLRPFVAARFAKAKDLAGRTVGPRPIAEWGATTDWNGGSAMAVRFLVLLTLTLQGRNQTSNATASLNAAGKILTELKGRLDTLFMTYGQYDAAVAGECPNPDALTQFLAWISEQGYYTTQTLIGVAPETFKVPKHVG